MATLSSLAAAIAGLTGARRNLSALAAGALGVFALPPFGAWPVLFVAFGVLILLLDGTFDGTPGRRLNGLRRAALDGWWWGFGYFLASLWWIGAAFLVDADVFAWLLPVAVTALPAGLALFMALGAALARLVWVPGVGRIFAFALAFTASEWLRGHLLTGFPWNTFGYALAQSLPLMQGAALVGLWGLTFLVLLVGAAPVSLLGRGRARFVVAAGAALVILAGYGWGTARLARHPTRFVDGVKLRVMQPDLAQDAKFAYGRSRDILADYLALSATPSAARPTGLADVTLLIWPESAFPFLYEREPWAAQMIADALPDTVTLVTGAVRYDVRAAGGGSPFFNAIRVIDSHGAVLQSTDKVHLVPFGEYLPFQRFLERLGLEQLTRVRGGFSAGEKLLPLAIPGAGVAAPLVCYEAIFPGAVIPEGPRPGFLLNLTNDAWFGLTIGPHQHFAQARLRSVEEGLAMVRAANTGISAVIDPMGRIVASLPLGARGNIDAPLPQGLEMIPPGSGGGRTVFVFLLFGGVIGLAASWRAKSARKS